MVPALGFSVLLYVHMNIFELQAKAKKTKNVLVTTFILSIVTFLMASFFFAAIFISFLNAFSGADTLFEELFVSIPFVLIISIAAYIVFLIIYVFQAVRFFKIKKHIKTLEPQNEEEVVALKKTKKYQTWSTVVLVIVALYLLNAVVGLSTSIFSPKYEAYNETQYNTEVFEQKTELEKLEGEWIQPIPGNEDEVQGFSLSSGGEAESINMATLIYKDWSFRDGKVYFTVESIGNGVSSTSVEEYEVLSVTEDTLKLKRIGDGAMYVYAKTSDYSFQECNPSNPCNVITENTMCPDTWMGNDFAGSYIRHVGNAQNVCDYSGSVTQAQCDAEGAMSTGGPHGIWCQQFINNGDMLLSTKRTY